METGLKFLISSILLCVTATLLIAINFIYKDVFKVEYKEIPKIDNVEVFDDELDNQTISVSKYRSHLGFHINYEVDKFDLSLHSNSIVYFYFEDNENIYLCVEKLNKNDYYESYKNGVLEEINNGYKYKYKYLRNNKSYYKLTIRNLEDLKYGYLDSSFDYMIDSFYILN